MKRTLCLLLSALLLLTSAAFAVSAADVTATVNGSAISSGDTIPAVSEIVFTLPYDLTSGQVAANVVLTESTKEATPTWNTREFDGYTLSGGQLTVPFALGDLAMNGDYKFTFKDPAGVGSDVEFAFKTSASDGYVMYDNFSRYPVGAMPQDAKTHYPFFTRTAGFEDGGNKYPAEITTDASGTKILRLNNSKRNNSENVVSYRTAFSAPVTETNYTGITEVEFSMLHETTSMFEICGIVFKVVDDNNIDVYMRHKNPAWNGSFGYDPTNWTKLGTATYGSKAETEGKHILKFIATHQTNANDKRTLKKLWLDDVEIGASVIGTEGLLFGSGDHSVLHQGVLLSNTGAFKNAASVTFDIMNAGGGCPVFPYMDIYSISYKPVVPVMGLSIGANDAAQFPVNEGVIISFSEKTPIISASEVASALKAATTVTGIANSALTVTPQSDGTYLLTAPFVNNKKYTVAIEEFNCGGDKVQGEEISFTTDWKQLTAAVAGGSSAPVITLPANTATSGDISLTIPAGTYELTNLSGAAVDYKAVLALYRKEGQSAAQQVDEEILTSATVAAGTPAALPEISVSYTDTKYNASAVSYFAKLFLISNDSLDEAKALSEPVIFGAAIDQGTHSLNLATVSVTADTDTATLDIKGTYGSYTNYKNRALWVYVTNDNGSDVFYDQLSSGTNGKYAISVLVDPQRDMVAGTYYNEYTVYVVPSRGMADDNYDEFDFDNVAPSADPSNMTITDNGTTDPANRTLTATYVYFDALDRAELGTTVTWKYADTADATTWTAVDGDVTTDTTLAITEELVGKYITCVVTPKNAEKSGSDYDYRDENTAVLVESLAPQVATLTVTDVNGEARKLKAEYTLSDPLATDRTGDTSEIKWYIADSEDGAYTEITATLADQSELPLTVEYAGKYIKCAVIPQYSDGANYWDTGRAYDSKVDFSVTPYYVKYRPVFKEVTTPGNELKVTQSGNTITVDTTLNDPLNHESDIPDITWTFKNSEGTVVKTISGTPVTTSYTATAADNGLTLIITAVPKIKVNTCAADDSCTDIAVGDPVESAPVTISYQSGGVDSFVGGNSGGSYGGGTGGGGGGIPVVRGEGKPVEENSAPVYQSPDEEMHTGALDLEDARGHWAEKEIFELYDKGIIKGKTANTFDPDGQITRAEFMAILVRAMGLDTVTFAGDFADVAAGSWYADILATAKQNGLLQGSGGYANPDQAITREEMVQIIVRAYEAACGEIKVGGGLLDYADASAISGWAQMAVIKANEISLVKGTGDGCFSPLANTTRAQSAVLIVRLMPHLEKAAAEEAAAKAAEEAEKAVVEENITDVGAENAPAAE